MKQNLLLTTLSPSLSFLSSFPLSLSSFLSTINYFNPQLFPQSKTGDQPPSNVLTILSALLLSPISLIPLYTQLFHSIHTAISPITYMYTHSYFFTITYKLGYLLKPRQEISLWNILDINVQLINGFFKGWGQFLILTQPHVVVYLEIVVEGSIVCVSVVSKVEKERNDLAGIERQVLQFLQRRDK